MLIEVAQVKKLAGKPLPINLEAQWTPLEIQGETLEFISPVKVEGTATSSGKFIIVDGTATVSLQRICGRCLEPVTEHIRVPFSANYLHLSEQDQDLAGLDPEKLVSYAGNNIDLSPQVREDLLLELAMSGLCREDCRGLCSNCGQNLNIQECNCRFDNLDPRLQVLEKYFKS